MLETTKDIFWLVLSIVILLSGLGISWAIFYMVLMIRDFKKITKSIRKKMEIIDSILEIIKKKTESSAAYLPPLIEGVTRIAEHFSEKKKAKRGKKKK
jgi:hypothetical protein